jgi:hypothetical protein
VVFGVKDEGKGFDYENLPDPTAPENLRKTEWSWCFPDAQLSG